MTKTAIILAGGFGTRLQSVVKDLPKPMALVAGKPFLEYLLQYLSAQGIDNVILSVGYKSEVIKKYFGDSFNNMRLQYSIEEEPLGTGGAILKAVQSSNEKEFFILNGDSFFNVNLSDLNLKHKTQTTKLSIALKRMESFDRYGVIKTDSSGRIISFEEKKFYEEGNINGGTYILHRELFSEINFPEKFSFEKDLMEKYCSKFSFCGFPFEGYFIDIGIPEDYERAQSELPVFFDNSRLNIDTSWTLFLDRDGVINKKIDGDYVRDVLQFEWLDGVKESLVNFSRVFGKVIIVSNQQGVGKRLMSNEHVETIHNHIIESIHDLGGKIGKIYFAPQLKEENSPMRKPEIGMALQAKKDFPGIDFSKSIMVGDSMSDMEFGKKAGMKTVFISHGKEMQKNELIDFVTGDLKGFATKILNLKS